jgi:hypothetical protein
MATIDLKKCTVKIQDGSTTPNSLTLTMGEGNLTYTIARNMDYILDRGTIDAVREGDEVPCALTIDASYEFYESDSGESITPAEALQKIGSAAAWVSSGSDPCEPYAVDIILEYDPDCSPTKKETVTFSEFRWESLDFDVQAGTINVSGNCNQVRPTSSRTT